MRYFCLPLLTLFILSPCLSLGQMETISSQPWPLEEFEKHVFSISLNKEAIPDIDKPHYIPPRVVEEGILPYLDNSDIVFVLEDKKMPRIYPRKVLVWHEVVNDVIDGRPLVITYCPLTDSAIAFEAVVDEKRVTFGKSGLVLNSNLVMADRGTGSPWPQMLGQAIRGPLKGKKLKRIALITMYWSQAKKAYAPARILSRHTGHLMEYKGDPYGSYWGGSSYYQTGNPKYPVMSWDARLKPKTVIVGVLSGSRPAAVKRDLIRKEKVVNIPSAGNNCAAFYDSALRAVRVFRSYADKKRLTFVYENGGIKDLETETRWSPQGVALEGKLKGQHLQAADFYNAMWFAWAAFYPNTILIR